MRSLFQLAFALSIAAGLVGAQDVDTKTVELHHLKPKEAVKLLSPYVKAKDGGVFDVGDNISIVTMRDTPENIVRMERVLAKYDHAAQTIRLVFQLIEADTGPRFAMVGNDGRVSIDLDSTLRSVLKFPTYRLLAQGVASVGEFADVRQELPTRDSTWVYTLTANVGAIHVGDVTVGESESLKTSAGGPSVARKPASTVRIYVRLDRQGQSVMATGLDVPLGHMVVLGTASTRSNGAALILTVKPELVPSH